MVYYRRRFGGYSRRNNYRTKKFSTYRKKWSRKRPIGSGEMGKRFFKIRAVQTILATDTGDAFFGFTDDPSKYAEFNNIQGLFDMYRVCAQKLKFIPNSTAATGYTAGYVFHDYNNIPTTGTLASALDHDNLKIVNFQRPWKAYFKCSKQIPMQSSGTSINNRGYLMTSSPVGTQATCIVATGMPKNQTLGQVICTLYVTAKSRV